MPTYFLLYINDPPGYVIRLITSQYNYCEVLVDLNAKKLNLFGVIGPIALLAIEA